MPVSESAPPDPRRSPPVSHVAILLLAPYASGAEHQTLALCRYLQQRCRVTLLTNDEFATLLASDPFLRAYSAPLAVVRLGAAFPPASARTLAGLAARTLAYPAIQLRAWRWIRAHHPDLVHLVLAPSFFAYAPLFYALPVPVVVTLAGEMRYVRHFYGPAKRAAVLHASRRASALVVCSVDELTNLRAVAPAALPRAIVLDNFTDGARFAPAPEKEPLVAYAARMHPEKGPTLFVDAAAKTVVAAPHVRFAMMGKGELDQDVAARIDTLGMGHCIERGFATDLAPLFARSSVFVSCQLHENLGSSSLLEAMASGNAVVATDVGQTSQIVDEDVGVRVPVDAGAIADALVALATNPARVSRLGAMARERVITGYGPEPYVDRLLAIYASVLP